MSIRLRLLAVLLQEIQVDLARPHPFAFERVGFLTCDAAYAGDDLLLFGQRWHVVADDDYIDDPNAGATIGGGAFRRVFQVIHREPQTLLHVHMHDHRGRPGFSPTDQLSMRQFVPGFFNVCRTRPHGALVLSQDSGMGALWPAADSGPWVLDRIDVVGVPLRRWVRS